MRSTWGVPHVSGRMKGSHNCLKHPHPPFYFLRNFTFINHADYKPIPNTTTKFVAIMAPAKETDGNDTDFQTLLTLLSCCGELNIDSKALAEAFGIARKDNA